LANLRDFGRSPLGRILPALPQPYHVAAPPANVYRNNTAGPITGGLAMSKRKSVMSATNDKESQADAAVIVFGTARGARLPQAGWFRAKDRDAAAAFAVKFGLSVLAVDTDTVRDLIPQVREAQLKLGQDPLIPPIDGTLLQRLTALHREAIKRTAGLKVPVLGGSSAVAPPPPERARWDALRVGDLVLAADLDPDGSPDGWFEAVITAIDGDIFHVRFRDYPEEGIAKLGRRHIALLYPQR